ANSGSVSPSKATATSRWTPMLRAWRAKSRGSDRLPAMMPRALSGPFLGSEGISGRLKSNSLNLETGKMLPSRFKNGTLGPDTGSGHTVLFSHSHEIPQPGTSHLAAGQLSLAGDWNDASIPG